MKVAIGDFCYDKYEDSDSIKMNFISVMYTRSPKKLFFPVGEFRAKLKLNGKRRHAMCSK
jgi:hypothetical protein